VLEAGPCIYAKAFEDRCTCRVMRNIVNQYSRPQRPRTLGAASNCMSYTTTLDA
jgi:hypothetical protein